MFRSECCSPYLISAGASDAFDLINLLKESACILEKFGGEKKKQIEKKKKSQHQKLIYKLEIG